VIVQPWFKTSSRRGKGWKQAAEWPFANISSFGDASIQSFWTIGQRGEKLQMSILRDRKTQTFSAKIPEREGRDAMLRHAAPPRPPAPPAPVLPPPSESDSAT